MASSSSTTASPGALSYADRYITRDGDQTWEAAEYKQFRYLFIAIRST